MRDKAFRIICLTLAFVLFLLGPPRMPSFTFQPTLFAAPGTQRLSWRVAGTPVTTNVLQASDFTYLGLENVPHEPGGYYWVGHPNGMAITGRIISGEDYLFLTSAAESGNNALQSDIALMKDVGSGYTTDPTTAPVMTICSSGSPCGSITEGHFGVVTDNLGLTFIYNDAGGGNTIPSGGVVGNPYCPGYNINDGVYGAPQITTRSIFWSEANSTLYVMAQPNYGNGLPNWATFAATLNNDGTHTAYGPWRLAPYDVPFAEQYYMNFYGLDPNGNVLIGGAGASGSTSSPWPLNLFSGDMPNTGTSVGCSTQTNFGQPWVDYPALNPSDQLNHDGTIISGHTLKSQRRIPANYTWAGDPSGGDSPWPFLNPDLNSGTGSSYNEVDYVWGGAWINGTNKQGMVFVGVQGQGCLWYGFANLCSPPDNCANIDAIPHASYHVPIWQIYDPAVMATVHNGSVDPWTITANSIFDPNTIAAIPTHNASPVCNELRGGWYSTATKRFYVSVENVGPASAGTQGVVLVYSVSDSAAPQPLWPLSLPFVGLAVALRPRQS